MAYRDRNQGFGFVYLGIDAKTHGTAQPPVGPARTTGGTHQIKALNFNKDPKPKKISETDTVEHTLRERFQAIHQIRENLDRLQSLHHKLHAMLEELNKLTEGEKKNR